MRRFNFRLTELVRRVRSEVAEPCGPSSPCAASGWKCNFKTSEFALGLDSA